MEELDKVYTGNENKEIELEFEGRKILIRVRELGWSEKNQILSQCFTYQTDGSVSFNFDRYFKLAISKIIVQAPWGETTNIFLNRIKPAFGALLEKLVPKAFEEVKANDFFAKGQNG